MRSVIFTGLTFGDEGKGRMVDWFAGQSDHPLTIVRFNGGSQARHRVETAKHVHQFAQLGSATLVAGASTILSQHMLIDLNLLALEVKKLTQLIGGDVLSGLMVDPRALLITPMQVYTGRAREVIQRRGSCGLGVGETVRDAEQGLGVRIQDLLNPIEGYAKMEALYSAKREQLRLLAAETNNSFVQEYYQVFRNDILIEEFFFKWARLVERMQVVETETAIAQAFARGDSVVFEGAQGSLLHRTHGFVPHVTQSDPTAHNALALWSGAAVAGNPKVIGIIRAHSLRHGPGPFVTDDSSTKQWFDDVSNPTNRWQGEFRTGWIDLVAIRYGMSLQPRVDALAMTSLDRLSWHDEISLCVAYEHPELGRIEDIREIPAGDRTGVLFNCRPVFETMPGWRAHIQGFSVWDQLPAAAQAFVVYVEEVCACPIELIGTGPRREHTIVR